MKIIVDAAKLNEAIEQVESLLYAVELKKKQKSLSKKVKKIWNSLDDIRMLSKPDPNEPVDNVRFIHISEMMQRLEEECPKVQP
jgi:hypothetical protein